MFSASGHCWRRCPWPNGIFPAPVLLLPVCVCTVREGIFCNLFGTRLSNLAGCLLCICQMHISAFWAITESSRVPHSLALMKNIKKRNHFCYLASFLLFKWGFLWNKSLQIDFRTCSLLFGGRLVLWLLNHRAGSNLGSDFSSATGFDFVWPGVSHETSLVVPWPAELQGWVKIQIFLQSSGHLWKWPFRECRIIFLTLIPSPNIVLVL